MILSKIRIEKIVKYDVTKMYVDPITEFYWNL